MLLSTIVWTNRGLAGDNFAATFGANAATARGVVDAALSHWARAIDNFNFDTATQFNVNISMRAPAGPLVPFSGDFGAQTNPANIAIDADGIPTSAVILVGRGNDTSGDGLGDGAGYFLDPTPNDWAEFPNVINNFAGSADAASPANGLSDLYSLVAHEMGHAVGMTPAAGSDWLNRLNLFATDTGINDTGGLGTLWAYNSATVGRVALTDSDGGSFGALAPHVARPGQTFNFNGQSYQSNVNVMNNSFNGLGRRHLINNLVVGMLDDVYSYDTIQPEAFGSFYTSLNTSTGILTLRGGANISSDSFTITAENGGYTISVGIGNDIPGTGPTDNYVSFFADTSVNGIVVDAFDGNDFVDVRVLGSNEPITINGGSGNDTIQLAVGDFDTQIASNVTVNAGTGTDRLQIGDSVDGLGSDTYTLTFATFSKPGRSVAYDDVEFFDLDGSPNSDVYNLQSMPSGMRYSIDGGNGNNVFNLAQTLGDLDEVGGPGTIQGSNGVDTLNLFDANDGANDNYLLDAPGADNLNFTKTGAGNNFAGLLHSGMNVFNLTTNAGNNLVTVDLLPTGTYEFDLNAGNDTLAIGNDNLNATLGDGTIGIDGGIGTDSLVIDDSSGLGNDTYVFDRTGTTGLFGRVGDGLVIDYLAIESARLDANTNPNTIRVDALPFNVALAVNASTGNDTLLIGAGDLDTNVLGTVAFDAFLGGRVVVDDDQDGLGADSYLLDAGTLSKASVVKLTFANVNDVELLASPNGDAINARNTFGYDLVIRGNGGDDAILLGGGNLTAMGEATIFGGDGIDGLTITDANATADRSFLVDQTGGLPFVSTFNGNLMFLYDSMVEVTLDSGPMDDAITTVNLPMGTRLRVNGNGGDDLFDVQGHRTLNNALFQRVVVSSGSGNDTLAVNDDTVGGGARVELVESEAFAQVTIDDGGDVRLASGDLLLDVSGFTMPLGGRLDLRDGRFVRRNVPNGPFFQLRLATGYATGDWNGDGINSSTAAATPGRALGYARGSDLFGGPNGVVSGTSLNAADLFIAYTIVGDANLNRTVNFDDLIPLAQNYNMPNKAWHQGNFNYDAAGVVSFSDLVGLAQNYNTSLLDALSTVTTDRQGRRSTSGRAPVAEGLV